MATKKERKNDKIGVYMIKNLMTGDFYIGSSVNIDKRWSDHISKLLYNKHTNTKLQNAINKHGLQYFIFGIIELCTLDEINYLEQKYINQLNPKYNILPLVGCPSRCIPLSLEHKERISRALKLNIPHYNSTQNIIKAYTQRIKPVVAYKDNIEYFFSSVKEASEYFNLSVNVIYNTLTKRKHNPKIKFKYANEA
jgi:hypothetical protein